MTQVHTVGFHLLKWPFSGRGTILHQTSEILTGSQCDSGLAVVLKP